MKGGIFWPAFEKFRISKDSKYLAWRSSTILFAYVFKCLYNEKQFDILFVQKEILYTVLGHVFPCYVKTMTDLSHFLKGAWYIDKWLFLSLEN